MQINKATYGGVDCTQRIIDMLVNGQLIMRADNNIIGDPKVGTKKTLQIWGEGFYKEVNEGSLVTIPEPQFDRLGIFYSNNNKPELHPSILKSLDTIKEASKGKADIICCMWQPMDIPFYQLISWYKSQSHLNQLLQIMQCLYSAREIHPYKYVSFLEHDVLYPEGYFDYPDFEGILTNMNYGGINREGWQNRGQDDEPFHQMTMGFEDAIRHCEAILPNALRTNSGMIESQTVKRGQWLCKNQAVHMNHGHHFTSHNAIYRRDNTYKIHPYWGAHKDYMQYFPKIS